MSDLPTLDWQKNPDGLLPAIVQDADTAQVLMLGYMNADALEQTLQTNLVTFFSRSKGRLWQKGETSGNILRFVAVSADCDGDTLLIRARPAGPTCHTGKSSCFDAPELPAETLGVLMATIRRRAEESDADISYTKRLLESGVEGCCAKVTEEAEEVVRAAKTEGVVRTTEEAADLLFHLLVLLQSMEIPLQDVTQELIRRRNPMTRDV